MVRAGLPEGVTCEQVYLCDEKGIYTETWGRGPGSREEPEERPGLE